MQLVKTIMDFAGLKPWQMYQRLKKPTFQSFESLLNAKERLSLRDLAALEDLYVSSGGTIEQFRDLWRAEAKLKKRRKKK